MTLYLDTSVILPALLHRHENYPSCRALLRQQLSNNANLITAAHTYGELYRHLTRNIPPFELAPLLASEALLDKLPKIITFIEASLTIYHSAIARCGTSEHRGAIIYDALHLELALAEGATVLYTYNTKDFNRLLIPTDALRVEGVN